MNRLPTRLVLPAALTLLCSVACHPTAQRTDSGAPPRDAIAWAGASVKSETAGATRGGPSQNDSHSRASDETERRATAEHAVAATNQPLAASAPLLALEVPGFLAATVSVPLGATSPRPVVLALHGNFDRPEWQCDVMRLITEGYPFVLCPRGIRRRDVSVAMDRWEYSNVKALQKEIDAGLAALRARFVGYVAEGPVVFTGFSLGAILGRALVAGAPAQYPRVLFTEGGATGWNWKRFKDGGGERVLFACAQAGCAPAARAVAKQAARLGVEVHVADGGNAGHTYDGPVAQAIQSEWAWLVEGDERWRASPIPAATRD